MTQGIRQQRDQAFLINISKVMKLFKSYDP